MSEKEKYFNSTDIWVFPEGTPFAAPFQLKAKMIYILAAAPAVDYIFRISVSMM